MVTMSELFIMMHEKTASDIHLTAGAPPMLRIDGELVPTPFEKLTPEMCQTLVFSLMTDASASALRPPTNWISRSASRVWAVSG